MVFGVNPRTKPAGRAPVSGGGLIREVAEARGGVCWQELAPPGGEVTAYADGDNCHPMAPRAILHNPSVSPTSPTPGAIILLRTREPLARGRLHMHSAHEGRPRSATQERKDE